MDSTSSSRAMTHPVSPTAGAVSLVLWLALAVGCDPVPGPSDAGRDAAPRVDAGFDPASLAPCTADPATAFDGTDFAAYTFATGPTALETRLFYPLALLGDQAGDLADVTLPRREGLRAAAACAGDAGCVRAAIAWSDDDADAAADAISSALAAGANLESFAGHIRRSGVCALFDAGDDAALVRACVRDGLLQATAALDGRVLGELDAAALDAVVDAVALEADTLRAWEPAIDIATGGLLAADRDEGVRYEPLAATENAATVARLRTIDFAEYPFVAIVVPGQGPTEPDIALSSGGRARALDGAARLAAGLAPVILVSGGHVHPDRTRFSEAIEMRRYLVETLGVAADAILVDPYARHTTTNLRNATRILVRAGVPTDRPILVTSDIFQTAYMRSAGFETRNRDELGYVAYQQMQELSSQDSCFLPVAASLHVDARDPLDP